MLLSHDPRHRTSTHRRRGRAAPFLRFSLPGKAFLTFWMGPLQRVARLQLTVAIIIVRKLKSNCHGKYSLSVYQSASSNTHQSNKQSRYWCIMGCCSWLSHRLMDGAQPVRKCEVRSACFNPCKSVFLHKSRRFVLMEFISHSQWPESTYFLQLIRRAISWQIRVTQCLVAV